MPKKVKRGRVKGLEADTFEFNFNLFKGHTPKKKKRKILFELPPL